MNINKLKGKVHDSVIVELPEVMSKFGINTQLRLSHFLAQVSHESGNFIHTSENLNYSADRLRVVFPKYFKQDGLAEAYARKPDLIASRVYGNRMGNGDEGTRDGYKFRGRGYIQLTGKSNYSEFDKFVDDDILLNPDLVATKYPLLSAAWFFHTNNINSVSDKGATDKVIASVTKRVNGGTIGLQDRINHFKIYYTLLQ